MSLPDFANINKNLQSTKVCDKHKIQKNGGELILTRYEENIEVVIPENESGRILQFYRMILLMNVDAEVNNKELDFIRSAGLRLGLRPMAIEKVLEEMKKGERGMIPEERLIDIFTTYRN